MITSKRGQFNGLRSEKLVLPRDEAKIKNIYIKKKHLTER